MGWWRRNERVAMRTYGWCENVHGAWLKFSFSKAPVCSSTSSSVIKRGLKGKKKKEVDAGLVRVIQIFLLAADAAGREKWKDEGQGRSKRKEGIRGGVGKGL